MNPKKMRLLFIPLLMLCLSHNRSVQAAPKVQFSILYTNDVMGEVEPCG